MPNTAKSSVLIADPEPMSRCGLAHSIQAHAELRLCGEAGDLREARELCVKLRPAALVLDPGLGAGFTFIRDMRRRFPKMVMVALTSLHDAASVQSALKAGVSGYVLRRDPGATILVAILAALRGERYVGAGVEKLLLERLACGSVELRSEAERVLSTRELEVFRLIGEGYGPSDVAKQLLVSGKTVESHQERIKLKLKVATCAELRRRAAQFVAA